MAHGKCIAKAVQTKKDMFNVPAQILVKLGLQLTQLLFSLSHVLLQLQTRLSGIIIASCQSSTVAHLVTYKVKQTSSLFTCSIDSLAISNYPHGFCDCGVWLTKPSRVMQSMVKARASCVETSMLRQIKVFPNTCLKALSKVLL